MSFKIVGHVSLIFLIISLLLLLLLLLIIIITIIIITSQSVIQVVYRQDIIHKFVMKIMALPFLPAHHKESMFISIESIVPPNGKMCEFNMFLYFYQPWIEHPVFFPNVGQCSTSLFVSTIIGQGHFWHGSVYFVTPSSQCSTTGVTKTVVCVILSVGWCI